MFSHLALQNIVILLSSLPLCLSATCAKCTIIERERIESEKLNPLKSEYFEDFQADKKIKTPSNNLPPVSKNSTSAIALVDKLAIAPTKKKFKLQTDTDTTDLAAKNGSTLADILAIDGLLEIFKEPFTLLIPSDNSVENFPTQIVTKLFKEKNRELLLSYIANHIVAHQILIKDFNKPYKTLGGRLVEISEGEDGLRVNETAKVLRSIPVGKHGVIYVLDQVLLPIHKF